MREQLGDDYETEFNRASGAQLLSRNYRTISGTDIAGDVRRRDEAENGDISVSDFLRSVSATAAGMAEGARMGANKVLGVGEGVQMSPSRPARAGGRHEPAHEGRPCQEVL